MTGEEVFTRTRFPEGASFTASPWAYNGKIFFLSEEGETYVMPAGREFTIEHTNALDELCIATPSIAQGKLLIRTAEHVYCIGREVALNRATSIARSNNPLAIWHAPAESLPPSPIVR